MEELWDSLVQRHIVIDTGTSSLASTSRLYEKLQSIGVAFAEAPLSGGMQQAKAGQLGALVGADIEVLEKISPLLEEFCSTIEHIGAGRCRRSCEVAEQLHGDWVCGGCY